MLKNLFILAAVAMLPQVALSCPSCGKTEHEVKLTSTPLTDSPRISDPVGRAGMVACTVRTDDGARILAIGGANFPNAKPGAKTPAERGAKVFYDEILSINPLDGSCSVLAKLPYPIGYAAHTTKGNDMVIAGGCNMEGHVATVTRIKADGSTEALPELPVTTAYPAFVQRYGKLYVFGGQEKADSVTCLSRSFVLDLKNPAAGWKEIAPMPGEGRMLAAAGTGFGVWDNGKIYVAGGCSLHPDAKGAAERTYLKSTLCYDPETDTWTEAADMPETIVAPATPMPAMQDKLVLLCGDPGNFYRASLAGNAPADHPGQNTTVYTFDMSKGVWAVAGQNSVGIATAPAVKVMGTIFIISGETHPGVRTPVISTLNLSK